MNKILPHIFALIISVLVGFAVFSAMMSTNNNGEFGYPDQGVYLWNDILPIVLIWMAIPFVLFEIPIIIFQLITGKAKYNYLSFKKYFNKIGK